MQNGYQSKRVPVNEMPKHTRNRQKNTINVNKRWACHNRINHYTHGSKNNNYIHYKQKDLDTSYKLKCYEVYNVSNLSGDLKRNLRRHHPEDPGQDAR